MLVLGAICLSIFFLRFIVFNFQESPKFLLYRGRDDKAVEVLHKIAKFNGRESSISVEVFEALTAEDMSMASRDTTKPTIRASTKEHKTLLGEKIKIELQRYKILFRSSSMTRLTLLVWVTYMFDYWGFNIAGWFLLSLIWGTGYPTLTMCNNSQVLFCQRSS